MKHKMQIKRILSVILIAAAITVLFAGCHTGESDVENTTFTDINTTEPPSETDSQTTGVSDTSDTGTDTDPVPDTTQGETTVPDVTAEPDETSEPIDTTTSSVTTARPPVTTTKPPVVTTNPPVTTKPVTQTPPVTTNPPVTQEPDDPVEPVNEYAVYVNPSSGNDANAGTLSSPVRTLTRAQNLARQYASKGDRDVTVYLRAGTYTLSNTLTFTSADSGKNGHTVTWCAYHGEKVVLSGGTQITGWTLHDASKNIWVANAQNITSRDFFVNGKRAVLARTSVALSVSAMDATSVTCSNSILRNLSRPQDVILVIENMWTQSRAAVKSAQASGSSTVLTMLTPAWTTYYNTADLGGAPIDASQIKYAENAYEFLDAAGEWYLNTAEGKLYYIPRSGENMASATAVLGRLEQLIRLEGTKNAPVCNLTFSGLTFSYTTWMQAASAEGLITIQANHYKKAGMTADTKFVDTNWCVPSAAVYGTITQQVVFDNNTFTNLGNAGIHLAEGTKKATISRNTLTDCAGSGIMLSGFAVTYHDCILPNGSNLNQNWYLISENNSIIDNTITNVASVYNGGVGIEVGYVRNTDVSYNTLRDLPYTAISFGWGWGFNKQEMAGKYYSDANGVFLYSGNSITHNYIDNIMNVLFDGGGIYTLGRNDNTSITDNYIANVNNDYGAIYLDNGSQGFTVTNNAIVNAYRNYIYKGDYNVIKNNYAKPASQPNMPMMEPLQEGYTHYTFYSNEKWDQTKVNSIKANAGAR